MTRDHLDQVEAIERASFNQPWSRQAFLGEMAHPAGNPLVALFLPSCLVAGYLMLWLVAGEVQVQNFAVNPAFRRSGVGRTLLTTGLAEAHRRGAVLATLEVRTGNSAARRLYRSLGFREVGVRPGYYQADREDAILMNLEMDGAFSSSRGIPGEE